MQTITTKYYGPTNTRGSRIKAQTESGIKAWISYPYEYSGAECHWQAVKKLLEQLPNWSDSYICGSIDGGFVFVHKEDEEFTR